MTYYVLESTPGIKSNEFALVYDLAQNFLKNFLLEFPSSFLHHTFLTADGFRKLHEKW